MQQRWKKLTDFWKKKLAAGAPVVLFLVVLSAVVLPFFGIPYFMTVSMFTTLFQVRRGRRNSVGAALFLLVENAALVALANVATTSLFWCVLLNALVPLVLVFFGSSQFQPKGHFMAAMMFVFHQTQPAENLAEQMVVVVICWAGCMVALSLAQRKQPAQSAKAQRQKGLEALSEILDRMAQGDMGKELREKCYSYEETYHRLAYQTGGWLKEGGREKKQYDILALLFQRSCYLAADGAWKEDEHQWQAIGRLKEVSAYVKSLQTRTTIPTQEEVDQLLEQLCFPRGRLQIYADSVVQMMQLFCQLEREEEGRLWGSSRWKLLWGYLRRRFCHNAFEKRFAVRLAVILVSTFTANYIFHGKQMYWLAMHAFLLLQPQYEDSNYRMITRPVGTVLGCILVSLVDPHLAGPIKKAAFAFLMISLMYCSTSGGWVQPIFSSGFAMTVATISMPVSTLPWLRLGYLAGAIFLVVLVNGFCFPVTKQKQFAFNLRSLYQLQSSYWTAVQERLLGYGQDSYLSGLLNQSHMIYAQAMDYVMSQPKGKMEAQRKYLILAWYCCSEAEQVAYCAMSGALREGERDQFLWQLQQFASFSNPLQPITQQPVFSSRELTLLVHTYIRYHNEMALYYQQSQPEKYANGPENEADYGQSHWGMIK